MPIDLAEYTPKVTELVKTQELACVYVVGPEQGRPCRVNHAIDIAGRVKQLNKGSLVGLFVHYLLWTPGRPVASRVAQAAQMRLLPKLIQNNWYDVGAGEMQDVIKEAVERFFPGVAVREHGQFFESLRASKAGRSMMRGAA